MSKKYTRVLRREIITDLGRYFFPDELLTESAYKLHIEHYTEQGFMIVFNKPENIELTKNDAEGNCMIVNIDTLR